MNTVAVSPALVNPTAWVAVDQDTDGTFFWRIVRTDGKLGTTSRTSFLTYDEAANAALVIAECKVLPLAADVAILIEMASPWYSNRVAEFFGVEVA